MKFSDIKIGMKLKLTNKSGYTSAKTGEIFIVKDIKRYSQGYCVADVERITDGKYYGIPESADYQWKPYSTTMKELMD